jgi:hypothetical protein
MSESEEWIHEIAVEAYVYLYPLVTMEVSRRQLTNTVEPTGSHAPANRFAHVRAFPAADFREVVRPNFDTLYSSAWLDLADGPVVVSAGEVADGRYYELPMYDMWTDCFAAPGTRTSGAGAGAWAVVPPGWTGDLPDGVVRIDAPTPVVWVIGRTQTNGPADYPAVHELQDGLDISPLSAWGGEHAPPVGVVDPSVDMATEPLVQVNALDVAAFFDLGLELLATHGPHLTDGPTVMRMRRAGLGPGARFADLAPSAQAALADVPKAGIERLQQALPRMASVVNGWQMNIETMGVYGNSYVKRAIVAMVGLGANSAEDAVYPLALTDADGAAIEGDDDYVLRFEAEELPPVDAFWSLTMYDADGFQVPNAIDRFAIGDRDALTYGSDGSLELYIRREDPGPDRAGNWLPSASGRLGLTLRLYEPQRPVLDGTWNPPGIRRVAS